MTWRLFTLIIVFYKLIDANRGLGSLEYFVSLVAKSEWSGNLPGHLNVVVQIKHVLGENSIAQALPYP